METCAYCGQPATFQLKNGKWCCQPFAQSCPYNKEQRRMTIKNRWSKLKEAGYRTQYLSELGEKNNFFNNKKRLTIPDIEELKEKLKSNPEECFCSTCGRPAKFVLKSGSFCCEEFRSQCPEVKRKDSDGLIKHYDSLERQGLKRKAYEYSSLSDETKEKMKIIKKGDTYYTNPIVKQCCDTRKKNFEEGTWASWNLGAKETEEHREAIRKGCIKYLEDNKQIDLHAPRRISVRSLEYIENLNKEKGWNLQHGYNKGEYEVGGYFVDGYDLEKNIVFEYDEKYHYKDWRNNILRDKDIERQNFIKKKLNCEFYRYNESLGLLYKV